MADRTEVLRSQLSRQVWHWTLAAARLAELDALASREAWRQLEQYLGVTVRKKLADSSERLAKRGTLLRAALQAASNRAELEAVNALLLEYRRNYLHTEKTLDFYADAIRTRTDAVLGALLRACDMLAYRSMSMVLDQLDLRTPVVLTYMQGDVGASILKAGLRLWDGSDSPTAVIKATRHNLHPGTALFHESGHQVAHLTGWTEDLAEAFRTKLCDDRQLAGNWAGWASEIVADVHAFVHTGFAAVASLHDVLAGDDRMVFRFIPGDPHPLAYLRVLLGVEMCRHAYGAGPWDDLAGAWIEFHPLEHAGEDAAALIRESIPIIPRVAELSLRHPVRGFRGRSICDLVNPDRVNPARLVEMERQLGAALYTSTQWIWTESIRLLALAGLRMATMPDRAAQIVAQQQAWMMTLGGAAQAA